MPPISTIDPGFINNPNGIMQNHLNDAGERVDTEVERLAELEKKLLEK